MKRVYIKIILPSILTILLFILAIFLIIIPQFQESIMNGKREMIKELTNSAWSILNKYENDEKNGLLTRDEAQTTAVSRIQYLRYGDESKDYFWITDLYPKMIMHPYRSDLNGKDLTNFTDPHGKKMFVEFVNTVKKSDHGYVDYMWQWKEDSTHIVSKLSYVKIFKPWGWVIGTGIYTEDVKKEIKTLTNKLVWISVGISILIAFLLVFIFWQSLKIERKRVAIENELQESKEKYRTLVEAATEGLIMLIGGKISFLNNVISKMTGFENSELINHSFIEILSDSNSKDILEQFSANSVTEGQFEINLKKKKGGFIEVLVASSTAVLFREKVNIIIVKDITTDRNSSLSVLDYQKLLSTMDIGFFRARIDFKGRFIFANEVAIKILGFDNFQDLSQKYILELLANSDDRKTLRNLILENGFIKNKILKIHKKTNEIAIVSVTLVAFNNEISEDLICDGIIEDITFREKERADTATVVAELKSSIFLMEQPVRAFLSPLVTLDSDCAIQEVTRAFEKRNSDCILLTKNDKDYIGIVTGNDIQKRVLALNLSVQNPAYLIMSSPVYSISDTDSVADAMTVFEEKKINHLVVKNNAGIVTGILRINDIYIGLKNSLSFLQESVKRAETDEELRQCYKKQLLFIKPLLHSGISVKYITNLTSSFTEAIIHRVVELTIKEIGDPPVPFSFIFLGSEGRKEETLLTDQDNAIVYENVLPDKEVSVNNYFNTLGEKVCFLLDYIGYSFCKGKIMANNKQWCKPISVWESYFTNWITAPEPQNLMDATIFFDFRNLYGDESITNRLRNKISMLIANHPLFFYHLAFNTFNVKSPQISSGNIITDRSADSIDLKNAINLIVMFTRTYALQNNVWHTNTLERLEALKEIQVLNESTANELIFAYNYLMKLRFLNQIHLSDNKLPLSNLLNTKNLIDIELSMLKKVLSLLPLYQNKISVDFRVGN